MTCFEVIPESVSQSTGLEDTNGVEIFEGDRVTIHSAGKGYMNFEIEFLEGQYMVVNKIEAKFKYFRTALHPALGLEITGNIHDNPELLEVK